MNLPSHRLADTVGAMIEHWQTPSPCFGNGRDPRSSENGLLLLFHGSLLQAARHDWLNAGRTLVDKTYLRILFSRHGLDFQGLSADELAARLDGAIRHELAPCWAQLDTLAPEAAAHQRDRLLAAFAQALFGTPDEREATSHLLFYLCPSLPLLAESAALRQGLEALGVVAGDLQAAGSALLAQLPVLPRPTHFAGDDCQQVQVRQLIERTDWWKRRVAMAWLQRAAERNTG